MRGAAPSSTEHARPLEVGERVRFRSLDWEVADVSDLAVSLFGRQAANRGRRLTVIPGLEPIERVAPPPLTYTVGTRGWDPADWQGMHDAYRLTLAQGRGSLGTAAWGRLILEPYQLVPLQRIERLPEPRLLIADDMGLGKTSEAGLILSRLLQRRRADRVLVVTRARPEPERWRDEMLEKFGIDFDVINDGQDYARLRKDVPSHLNLYAAVPRLIISMHFAAQADRLPDLDRPGLRWDVAIIDEAHHVADRGGDTRLSALGRVVARAANALLLLTATPHDGKVTSFASLIELVDEYAVADREHLQARLVRPLIVRRLKSQVVKSGGERFVQPRVDPVDVEPRRLPAERHLERGIRGYARQLRKLQKQLEAHGDRGAASGYGFLESLLRKRLASSVKACRTTLEQRLSGLTDGAAAPAEDQLDLAGIPDPDVLPDGRTERSVVEDLLGRCARIPEGTEAKIASACDLVEQIAASGEKVVVFTEYRDTLETIVETLAGRGLREADQVLIYHGGTTDRDSVRRRFLGEESVRVLVATDAASEGINLQEGCRRLIHVEVPWNPNRYEQRNGRIDRYGQREQPVITLLVARGYVEERAAEIVALKLEQIAKDVGSVSNVAPFARAVAIEEYLAEHAGGEADDTVDAERVADELSRRIDAAVRTGVGDIPDELIEGERFEERDLATVEGQLEEAAEFAPSFDDVRQFLTRYLRQEGGTIQPMAQEPGVYRIELGDGLAHTTGLRTINRATFDRSIATREATRPRSERVAFMSPGHPVIMTALRRARAWALLSGFMSRTSYRRVATKVTPGIVFTFAVRLLDGRGETVEERFEAVSVSAGGTTSIHGNADLALLRVPEERGALLDLQERALRATLPARFDALRDRAVEEAWRRARERRGLLARDQANIASDALVRLGVWRERAEARLDDRLGAQRALLLDPVDRRRHALYERRMREIAARAEERRRDIESMREVRVESVDPIGALVLVPPQGWPDA